MKKICVCIILLVMLLSISGTVFGESFSGNIVENIPETTIYDLTTKTKITGLVCIEPSQMLYTDKGYSYDDLKSLPEEKITSETDEDLDEFVSDGEKTFGANTYFYAKEDMTKDYEKDYKLWFIASFAKDIKDKQMAIWNYVAGPTFPTTSWYEKDWKAKGDELHEAAKAADEFLSTLIYNEDKDGNTISEKKEDGYGFTIKENNFEKVNVRTLTETEDIIVGPYQVEFDTGRFAGNIIEDEAGNIIEDEEEKAKGSRYIDIKFSYVDKAYIIDEKGEKIKDVEIVNVDGSKAEVSSAKPFYIKYNPYKDDGKTLMPSVRLCLDFKYLSGFTDKVYDKYKGCNYSIYYSKKYLGEGLGYEYTKHEFPSEGFSDNGQALADIKAQASWNNETHIFDVRDNEEFDLSLKKFITKVEYKTSGEKTIDDRVTVENTEGLYNKITHNAIYNKIYDPYKITKDVKSITYTIRIFNEGDVDGKAIKVEDYLPEGLEFDEGSSVVESAGYKVTYDKNSRKITFIDEGEVSNIAAFDGKNLSYTDIKIKCTVNDDVYEEVKYGEKKYDVSIEQYIGSKGNRTKEVEEGEEVKYTIEVTNKGDTKVYLKEIKQSLPKGIEFADNVDEWIVINNSDGSTEVSKIICEDIEGKSSKTYELKCKVTAKAGVLKTVSEIVSIAEPDINKSDWKDYAKVTVKNTVDSHVDLKLEQEIVSVNGKEVTGDEKKNKEVSKGDVIKYKITVTNEGTTSASNIRIADYIPDGMEFIPPSTDSEYEELKSIADDEFIEEKVGTTNAKWKYGENKNTVEYKSGLN